MVKGKGISPSKASRLTTRNVISLFVRKDKEENFIFDRKLSWDELRVRARARNIPDMTLKRVVSRLIDRGILRERRSKEDFRKSILTFVLDYEHIQYLTNVIDFLEDQLEHFCEFARDKNDPINKLDQRFFLLSKYIYSNVEWQTLKQFITQEDIWRFADAHDSLYKIEERWIISSFKESQRKEIETFLQKVRELADIIYAHEEKPYLENIRARQILEREMKEKIFYDILIEGLHLKKMDKVNLDDPELNLLSDEKVKIKSLIESILQLKEIGEEYILKEGLITTILVLGHPHSGVLHDTIRELEKRLIFGKNQPKVEGEE